MRFDHMNIKDGLEREFPECIFVIKEHQDIVDIILKNEEGDDLTLNLSNSMTLNFNRWHEEYAFRDEEYERLLWDIKDIINNTAYAMSVYVGDHLYIARLMRVPIETADDLISDAPEFSGLYKTGAVIESVYCNNKRSKKIIIEKRQ